MDACPGVCNSAWRATGEGDPRPGDPIYCAMDFARIRRLLAELDDLAALLEYHTTGYSEKQAGIRAYTTPEPPSPSSSADDLDELERMLLAWEDAYRDDHNRNHPGSPWPSPPRRGTLAAVITSTVAWLTSHLDGILRSGLAEDFGAEIGQWHREFVGKTRAGTGRHRKPVPCPRCGLRLLTWEDGDDYLACSGCNRHMSMDEYRDELAAAARDLEQAG
jgi:hypothetical protein